MMRQHPSTEEVIAAYAAVARPIQRRWMPAASCIGATKLTQTTLALFGVPMVPVPTKFMFQVLGQAFAYVAGFKGAEKEQMRRASGAWRELEVEGGGWCGHLIGLAAGRYLIDCTIDQVSSEELHALVPSEPLIIDMGDEGRRLERGDIVRASFDIHAGRADITYMPTRDRSYEDMDAWQDESLPVLAWAIAEEMRRVSHTDTSGWRPGPAPKRVGDPGGNPRARKPRPDEVRRPG